MLHRREEAEEAGCCGCGCCALLLLAGVFWLGALLGLALH